MDSTVQEKYVAYLTDSRLLEVTCNKLVKAAAWEGIFLRQSYVNGGGRAWHGEWAAMRTHSNSNECGGCYASSARSLVG